METQRNLPIIRGRKLGSEAEDLHCHQHRTDEELKSVCNMTHLEQLASRPLSYSDIKTFLRTMFASRSVPKRLLYGDYDMPSWSIDAGRD